ncbi:MAG: heme ABC exporter ATP-binding protein CcmA [Polyangiaceae bacterium]|nr:heme ABC exporter ATP-binding protein CcmA [Polyangiaceae bacterium]
MGIKVRCENVSKSFGRQRVLSGIELTFEPGSMTVLAGPNGCGKTTLLSLLGGLVKPTYGRIVWEDRSREDARTQTAWVGHETMLYADLSARENLLFSAGLFGQPASRVEEALAKFDALAFANRPVRQYSRGQKQRTTLARAFLVKPELLLLDEPTTGLDRNSEALLSSYVQEEKARGVTIVAVTHDQGWMANERIVELERGRLRG